MMISICIFCLLPLLCHARTPADNATNVFVDGEAVPGLPYPNYTYGFQIPIVVSVPWSEGGLTLIAFAQAYVRQKKVGGWTRLGSKRRNGDEFAREDGSEVGSEVRDGNDGWIDIVARRSTDAGARLHITSMATYCNYLLFCLLSLLVYCMLL